jgi:hypothetical protein
MWYINRHFDLKQIDTLPPLGFSLRSTGGVVRIEKYGCGSELRRAPDESFVMTELPTIMYQGQFTRLWDAGYQKFLITHDDTKVPAHMGHLSNLRKFNEELRTGLGVPTYYNEALGSTCHFSVYDRVKGRPGAVPDDTVGVVEQHHDED